MSDLDTGIPESPGTGSSPGWRHETAESASGNRHESPARTDDYREHEETQPGTEARIAMQDELPSLAQSQAATWGDSPEYYDEAELAGTYDGDLGAFLAAGDDLPTPQESRARTWGDNPEYYDETSLASGHDEDPGTPATEEHDPAAWHTPARPEAHDTDAESAPPSEETAGSYDQDTGNRDQDVGTAGHQPDQARTDLATTESGPVPETRFTADGSTADVPEAPSPELPPGSEHGDVFTERVAQPDGDQAVPDTPPEADLKQQFADLRNEMQAQVGEGLQAAEARYQASLDDLKAEYEAGKVQDRQQIDDLRAELQALKDDRPQPAPEVTGNTGIGADQPHAGDRKLPTARKDASELKPEGDRPGFWSNAKAGLYGAVTSAAMLTAADQFAPGLPHPLVDIATGAVQVIAVLVPVLREGRKGKHDNPPDNP